MLDRIQLIYDHLATLAPFFLFIHTLIIAYYVCIVHRHDEILQFTFFFSPKWEGFCFFLIKSPDSLRSISRAFFLVASLSLVYPPCIFWALKLRRKLRKGPRKVGLCCGKSSQCYSAYRQL